MNIIITNRKHRGKLTEKTQGVVINSIPSRNNPGKVEVSYYLTENIGLLAGDSTVAVYRQKTVPPPVIVTLVEEFDFKKHFGN